MIGTREEVIFFLERNAICGEIKNMFVDDIQF